MKYQIYLRKDISEFIEACSKVEGISPATFIKNFVEKSFSYAMDTLGETKAEEVKKYGRK